MSGAMASNQTRFATRAQPTQCPEINFELLDFFGVLCSLGGLGGCGLMERTEIEFPTLIAGRGSLTTHSQSTASLSAKSNVHTELQENPIVLAQVRDKLLIKALGQSSASDQ